jgi:hypothetical protein
MREQLLNPRSRSVGRVGGAHRRRALPVRRVQIGAELRSRLRRGDGHLKPAMTTQPLVDHRVTDSERKRTGHTCLHHHRPRPSGRDTKSLRPIAPASNSVAAPVGRLGLRTGLNDDADSLGAARQLAEPVPAVLDDALDAAGEAASFQSADPCAGNADHPTSADMCRPPRRWCSRHGVAARLTSVYICVDAAQRDETVVPVRSCGRRSGCPGRRLPRSEDPAGRRPVGAPTASPTPTRYSSGPAPAGRAARVRRKTAWLCDAPGRNRTSDTQIRSLLLYPLSYGRGRGGLARGDRWDSNPRPPGPQPGATTS